MALTKQTRRDAGLTLVEVLAALAIASMVLVLIVRASTLGIAAARAEHDMTETVVRARSLLASFTAARSLSPGTRTGQDDDGYQWRVGVARIGVAPPFRGLRLNGGIYASDTALYAVSVTVSGGAGQHRARTVTLASYVLIAVAHGEGPDG